MSIAQPDSPGLPLTQIALWISKLVVGGLFLWAGAIKLIDPSTFVDQVANYQLVPALAPLVATTLPGVEVLLGIILIIAPARGSWLAASALVSGGLMLLFLFGTAQAMIRGIDIECGCFGSSSGPVDSVTIARDLVLLAMCSHLWWVANGSQTNRLVVPLS